MPRDILGNELREGDMCAFKPDMEKIGLIIAHIKEIHEGGVIAGRSNQEMPNSIRIQIDVTLTNNNPLGIYMMLGKLVNPQADEALKKIMDQN